MMFMCTSKFDIESEQLTLVNEYLTAWEIQAAREEKDAYKTGDEFKLISDDEEDAPVTISPQLWLPSEHVPSKRPRVDITEDQEALNELNNENDEDENTPCLTTATCMAKIILRGEHQDRFQSV